MLLVKGKKKTSIFVGGGGGGGGGGGHEYNAGRNLARKKNKDSEQLENGILPMA